MVFDFKTYGQYPKEYNREIHGPYDPSRYYGKPDTPFEEVKLKELPNWVSRRSLNPRKWLQACDRWVWRYHKKWVMPRNGGAAPIYQAAFWIVAFSYWINHKKIYHERHFKYH